MTDKLAAALAKAQAEMENAPLNKTNPHFRSKYADLAAIRDATMPALAKHGLAIVQFTKVCEHGSIRLVTRLMHASGETIDGEYPLPITPDKPQVMGSAMTYARRYCWAAMCGITADEDDDANEAQASAPKAAQARPVPQQPRPAPVQQAQADDPFAEPVKLANALVIDKPAAPSLIKFPATDDGNRAAAWKAWADTMKDVIDTSESVGELAEWMAANDGILKNLAVYCKGASKGDVAAWLKDRAQKRMSFLSNAPVDKEAG